MLVPSLGHRCFSLLQYNSLVVIALFPHCLVCLQRTERWLPTRDARPDWMLGVALPSRRAIKPPRCPKLVLSGRCPKPPPRYSSTASPPRCPNPATIPSGKHRRTAFFSKVGCRRSHPLRSPQVVVVELVARGSQVTGVALSSSQAVLPVSAIVIDGSLATVWARVHCCRSVQR
jgi:hypothetical protein